jgi:hypothetical protein
MIGISFPTLSLALRDKFKPKKVLNFELLKNKFPVLEIYISTFGLARIYQLWKSY